MIYNKKPLNAALYFVYIHFIFFVIFKSILNKGKESLTLKNLSEFQSNIIYLKFSGLSFPTCLYAVNTRYGSKKH